MAMVISDIDTELFVAYKMKSKRLINDLINELGYLYVHY